MASVLGGVMADVEVQSRPRPQTGVHNIGERKVREMNVRAMAFASIAVLLCMALSGCPPRKPEPIVGYSGTSIMTTA